MKPSRLLIVAFIIGLTLSGCAATGAKFTEAIAPPADQALIYFYRPKQFYGGALIPTVLENKNPLFEIQHGQFIPHTVRPGTYEYHTESLNIDRVFKIEVEAGKTYFVRLDLKAGMWVNSWIFSRIFPEDALPEMRECCKAGEPSDAATQS